MSSKISDIVLQKMQLKKALKQANRPHYQLLQLQVKFNIEQYQQLTSQIQSIQTQLNQQNNHNEQLSKHAEQLDDTGKKNYPRIIIKSEFIGSQNINTLMKQFYRKSANSFLKNQIIRKKNCDIIQKIQQSITQLSREIHCKQQEIQDKLTLHHKINNEKRMKILKQQLRLRTINQEIEDIRKLTQQERNNNLALIKEYQLKKTNLTTRIAYSHQLSKLIALQKAKIQSTYNPTTYRSYLRKIFLIRSKNQMLRKNIQQLVKQITQLNSKTEEKQKILESQSLLRKFGKTFDSPSRRRGRINSKINQNKSNLSQYNSQNQTPIKNKNTNILQKNRQAIPRHKSVQIKNNQEYTPLKNSMVSKTAKNSSSNIKQMKTTLSLSTIAKNTKNKKTIF